MKLVDLTVKDFIDKVDSNEATPGGGSVSALAIAKGIGLIRMVAKLTIGKKKFLALDESIKNQYIDDLNTLDLLKQKAISLVDLDTDAFNVIMDAFKMPKETEEDVKKRKEALKLATLDATKIPYQAASVAYDALKTTQKMVPYANKNAISDLGVGSLLMMAGLEGAILNVKTNMLGYDDVDIVQEYDKACDHILYDAKTIHNEILTIVHHSLDLK